MGQLQYPMLIVTTSGVGETLAGCLVGFATQTSIDPARYLVCLSRRNRTYRVARQATTLIVHLVPRSAVALAELFGGETGDDVDKFAHCAWKRGPDGAPVLDDCPSWFAGRIVGREHLGDHTGFLLEPYAGHSDGDTAEFDFRQARHISAGHPA